VVLKQRGLIMLMITASFLPACSCKPILYKPTIDPSLPILGLKVPETIETLSGLPRDRTHADNGINLHSRSPQPDNVKEMFELFKETDSSHYLGTQYYFRLYLNEEAAIRNYEFQKSIFSRHWRPIFNEVRSETCAYYLTYINQLRNSREGFCSPQSNYVSEFTVRLRNLVVQIEVRTDNRAKNAALMMSSVEYLAALLAKSLNIDENQDVKIVSY
jgi:hypothetical protein